VAPPPGCQQLLLHAHACALHCWLPCPAAAVQAAWLSRQVMGWQAGRQQVVHLQVLPQLLLRVHPSLHRP
jgi:hypothetical protein